MIADLKPYAVYKESGQDWLGSIPAHWSLLRAKRLFREVDERSKTGKEELLSVSHLTGVTPRRLKTVTMFMAESNVGHKVCCPGDLVINTLWAWMAALGVTRHTGIVSPAYGVYRPIAGGGILPAYADHLLRTPMYAAEYQRRSTGVNSSRLRLYPEQFLRIPVFVPPLDEQAAIVRFLDRANGRLDRTIRTKRKVVALLTEQKQAVVHRALSRGLDPAAPLKPSGIPWLGVIPEHWSVVRLKSVLVGRLTNGLFKRADAFGSGVPLVNVSDLYSHDGLIHKETLDRVRATPKEVQTFRVFSGDIFFVRSSLKLQGTGRCSLAASIDPDTVFECHVVRATPNQQRVEPRFITVFLGSWVGVNNTVSRANMVTMATLDQGSINSLPLAVPPLSEQREILVSIDAACQPILTAIGRLEAEIELLREYRASLVTEVVTGKLDVREAAARFPDEGLPEIAQESIDETDTSELVGEEAEA